MKLTPNDMYKNIFIICVFSFFSFSLNAQQTVGIFSNSPDSYDGYTLFGAAFGKKQYLINNCGEQVHSWDSEFRSGSTYLLENGVLVKTGGGGVEMIDWDNTIIWQYSLSDTYGSGHHDIEILPNGNILLIARHQIDQADVLLAGGSTDSLTILSDQIVEIEPDLLNGGASVVWEWKAWDHLIQDADSTKDHYGTISLSPEKIDINFISLNGKDWLHINGIDYNAQLDQIMLSVPTFNEFWIIDHSTSSVEAASSEGGDHDKGGDLIYRWGNPSAYDQGDSTDQKLYFQHNPHWIEDSLPDAGKILLFNNQVGSAQSQDFSTVNTLILPLDSNGLYPEATGAYGPSSFYWTYTAPNPTDFYSGFISGSQRLPNQNTLICEGVNGRFFEIDSNENIVWEYISPLTANEPIEQEETPEGNQVFRCTRYPRNYAAFENQAMLPQGYIESGSTMNCELHPLFLLENLNNNISFYPNPSKGIIHFDFLELDSFETIHITNIKGQTVLQFPVDKFKNEVELDISSLENGVYFVRVVSLTETRIHKVVLVQ